MIPIATAIYKKDLGETIRRLSAELNIPLSQIEQASCYSPGMLSRWASSSQTEEYTALSKLATIADILGVSVDTLLGRAPPKSQLQPNDEAGLVKNLLEATRRNSLIWREADADEKKRLGLDQLTVSPTGRTISEMWVLKQDKFRFLMAAYCDNSDDLDESMEFILYYVVGHKLPPYPIQISEEYLQNLYVCLQIQQAQQALMNTMSM